MLSLANLRLGKTFVGILLLSACGSANAEGVAITGDMHRAGVVLEIIRAAEIGDESAFRQRIGGSAEPTFEPPAMADVDRTDETCVLRSIDASGPMVSVLWSCEDNTKPNVQRTFLVEHGRVTHVWNDWAGIL